MHPVITTLILSAVTSAAVGAVTEKYPFIPLFFLAAVVGYTVLLWIVFIVSSAVVNKKKIYETPSKYYLWLLNYSYAFFCGWGRVKINTSGLEKLPDKPFLLVSNHVSQLDNMVQSLVLRPRPIAFIAKEELFKIPIVRGYITRCCYLKLTRSSTRQDKSAIERAEDYINRGILSVGVFPEGHRGDGVTLQKFHAGSFKIAIKTGCPIVVSSIIGTEKVHKRFPFRTTKVWFDIIDVIDPKGRKSTELSEEIRNMIQDNIAKEERK